MTLGLLPFVFASAPFVPGAWIGWVVLVNGAMTHLTCAFGWRYCDYMRVVDTAANAALCVLVNALTHWQPQSLVLTLLVALFWAINSPQPLDELGNRCAHSGLLRNWLATTLTVSRDARSVRRKQARSVGVHIVLVQWVLCFLLVVHEHDLFR